MRRAEKAMSEAAAIDDVIRRAQVCRLAMVDGDEPYVVPLSFGYEPGVLYFHSAAAGRKIEVLRRNPRVCFELDVDCEVVRADRVCAWGVHFRSVIGFGTATFVDDMAGKRRGLQAIARQYGAAPTEGDLPDSAVADTVVLRVQIQEITGKRSPPDPGGR